MTAAIPDYMAAFLDPALPEEAKASSLASTLDALRQGSLSITSLVTCLGAALTSGQARNRSSRGR